MSARENKDEKHFDVAKGLQDLIDLYKTYHNDELPLFGSEKNKTQIWDAELDYRKKGREVFQRWLDGEAVATDTVAKQLNLYRLEYQDLAACLRHPDNIQETEKLRKLLARLHREGDEASPKEALDGLKKHLRKMENAARNNSKEKKNRIGNGIAKKWTVFTALLSFANEHFPFIRPTTLNPKSEGVGKLLFGDIPWQSEPTGEYYAHYCDRFEEIAKKLKDADLGESPLGLLGVSAWCVGVHNAVQEPMQFKRIAELARGGPVILQGPPGTGKTWYAERLPKQLLRSKDGVIQTLDAYEASTKSKAKAKDKKKSKIVTHFVQFHASFDYEDFVRGFRPVLKGDTVGFKLQDGPFARMVSQALAHPDVTFLLVIDEINRADLARVLGECIYLLDRRVPRNEVKDVLGGTKPGAVALRYQPPEPAQEPANYDPQNGRLLSRLCVPENFLLLGTMNTADRSIAVVDAALRRRFAFFDMLPDPEVVRNHFQALEQKGNGKKNAWANRGGELVKWMQLLNGGDGDEIDGGKGYVEDSRYHIGHSYFLKDDLNALVRSVHHQLLPLLREYKRDGHLPNTKEVGELLKEVEEFPAT